MPIGGPGVRGLLALLALQPGKVVALDDIIDALWGHDPPATARTIIHGNVSHLRRVLRDIESDAAILTTPPGYRLVAEPGQIDAHRARTLLDRASVANPETAAALLAEALALWQGPVLGGVPESVRAPELAELRRAVHGARVDADLNLGRHAELIVELSPLADPLEERTAGQLMRALYHAGRRGAALELYRTVSRATVGTLGVEPGAELRWLHERVLNDDLPAPAEGPAKAISQLPAAVPSLAGRGRRTRLARRAGHPRRGRGDHDRRGHRDRSASARARWSSGGPTASRRGSRTASCSPRCAASTRTTRRWSPPSC